MATVLLAVAFAFFLTSPVLVAVAIACAFWVAAGWRVDWVPLVELVFFLGALAGLVSAVVVP